MYLIRIIFNFLLFYHCVDCFFFKYPITDKLTDDNSITSVIMAQDIFKPLLTNDMYKKSMANMEQKDHDLANILHSINIQALTEVSNIKENYKDIYNYSARLNILPITSQEKSGRCWIFAFLNLLRSHFAKFYSLPKFEFSQSHFAYWMTVERFNMYFASVLRMFEQNISTDSPIYRQLVQMTLTDGGTWPMALNILNKYGLLPKSEFPETMLSSDVFQLKQILRRLLIKHTYLIQSAVNKDSGITPENAVSEAVSEVQGIVTLAYGIPPAYFTYTTPNKEHKYEAPLNISSLQFFRKIVQPIIDPNKMISLVSDGRPNLKKGRSYIIQLSGLFAEHPSGYICNVEQNHLEQSIVRTLKSGFPVWISIDFNRFRSYSQSVLDLNVHNYRLLNDLKYPFLNKTERSSFRSSFANHAVLITDVAVDSDDYPIYYRIENSHGVLGSGKGFLWMSRDWFREFGTEAVVLKSTLTKNARACLNDPGMLLPIWDCLGVMIQ